MNVFRFLLGFAVICFMSCGGDNSSAKTSSKSDETALKNPLKNVPVKENAKGEKVSDDKLDLIMRTSADRDYTAKRPEAIAILEHRIANDPENYPIVEQGIFEYEMVHDGTSMSKYGEYEGNWIDFQEGHTYVFGKNKETQGGGRYHYDFNKGLMLMVDNDKDANPQEWKCMRKAHVMILVGNEIYGNNNYQMKLVQRKNIEEVMDPNYVDP